MKPALKPVAAHAVYRTDPPESSADVPARLLPSVASVASVGMPAAAASSLPADPGPAAEPRSAAIPGQVPLALLAAVGERLAAGIAALQQEPAPQTEAMQAELMRLERLGLQLQEMAQVVARAQQLRQESVDLGLALLQTVAEWSAEADHLGVELHGPARSVMVHANPAALKHLLDLMVEHALQQGNAVRLEIESPAGTSAVLLVVHVSSEPASSCPTRDTPAWLMLQWLARALGLRPQRLAVERGERLVLALPGA